MAGRLFDAPETIHNSMTLISAAVSGGLASVGMKSFSSGDKLMRRNSSLCFVSPGFTTTPSFPPRITFSKLSSCSFPFLFCALWQLEHLFSKIGATRAAKNVTDDAELPFTFFDVTFADVTVAAWIGGVLPGTAGTCSTVRSLPGMYFVRNASPCVSLPPLSAGRGPRNRNKRKATPHNTFFHLIQSEA